MFAFFNTSAELAAPGEKGFKHKAKAVPPFVDYRSGNSGADNIQVMVMEDTVRQSYVLEQGLFDQPGKKVEPRTPSALPEFDGYPENRLDSLSG